MIFTLANLDTDLEIRFGLFNWYFPDVNAPPPLPHTHTHKQVLTARLSKCAICKIH